MSCAEAAEFERRFFARGGFDEREAIRRAGRGIAEEFLREFDIGNSPRIIAIAGGGHNGADAIAAASKICGDIPGASLCVAAAPREKQRPDTALELDALLSGGTKIEKIFPLSELPNVRGKFDLAIEGLVGMTFRPPARAELGAAIEAANALDARIKISADIPAGISADAPQTPAFRADATYAAGIAKDAIFKPFNRPFAGRIRFVDIGFFDAGAPDSARAVVRPSISEPLKALRPALSDKRSYGHAFVLAGSRRYPGGGAHERQSRAARGRGACDRLRAGNFRGAIRRRRALRDLGRLPRGRKRGDSARILRADVPAAAARVGVSRGQRHDGLRGSGGARRPNSERFSGPSRHSRRRRDFRILRLPAALPPFSVALDAPRRRISENCPRTPPTNP